MESIIKIFNDLKALEYVTISGNTNRLGDYILKIQKEAYNQALKDAANAATVKYGDGFGYQGTRTKVDKKSILKLKKK